MDKPRLTTRSKFWKCISPGYRAYGKSAEQAYKLWLLSHMLPPLPPESAEGPTFGVKTP